MKGVKFGGTSVGSAQRMKDVAKLITDGEQKIVALPAMSGTTNTLVEISDYLYKKNPEGANEVINKLEAKYKQHIDELFSTEEYKQKTLEFVKSVFDYIRSFTKDIFTLFEEKVILAQGEIISTNMVTNYLCEQGVKAVLIPALEFMRTDKNSEPDLNYIREKLALQLEANPGQEIYITQGFICRNAYGEIDNLQRGGSDYTASLIGAAVNASEIQIWTDIDGMHDNDPRVVDKTSPVRQLHFEEAAELAYFGAKILHPTCVQPAKYANIPVRLLNTMEPSAPIAIPISALESTGASLIPSPTNASISSLPLLLRSFSTSITLSAGKSSLLTSSTPSFPATCSATFLASPVSIITFLTPAFLSAAIACCDVGLITSDITIQPAYMPPIATYTSVPRAFSMLSFPALLSMLYLFISFKLPANTSLPPISAFTPCPLISSISVTCPVSTSIP